ncbi:hypothetical protein Q7P37_003564 [Cladosporium fusiforme]
MSKSTTIVRCRSKRRDWRLEIRQRVCREATCKAEVRTDDAMRVALAAVNDSYHGDIPESPSTHVLAPYEQNMREQPQHAPAAQSEPKHEKEQEKENDPNQIASPLSASPDRTSIASHNNNDEDNKSSTLPSSRFASARRAYDTIVYTPKRCRWDPVEPPKFTIWLNLLFGAAGAFTVANLYYTHPILAILAEDFGVDYVQVAEIPTLAQAGYAVGLLLLCPLGDLLKRRPFVLYLVFFTASLSIGLATTGSLVAFQVITFLTGVSTVTPQLMLPLVGDLAPPQRRASAMSIVVSGLTMGILVARVLSGIMTQYTTWRAVYWLSVALQYTIWFLLYLFMPDYPSSNPSGLNYFKMLWSMLIMLTKHPQLVQAGFITFFTSATFTNFWTTLTFLLSDDPYNYSTVVIGLFALIGIASMCIGPFHARWVIDRFVPNFSVILGMIYCLIGITLGTYTGTFTVAGPVIQAFLNDFGMQTSQIANRTALFAIEPKARSRVNTVFMVFTFCGQLVGTSVGSNLYDRGGWIASGSYSMGSIGAALVVCFLRGPWEHRWLGWRGGWSIRKKTVNSSDGKTTEERNPLRRLNTAEKLEDQARKEEAERDLERGKVEEEKSGDAQGSNRCNQDAVNAMGIEKALEGRAAQDKTDEVYGEDEQPPSNVREGQSADKATKKTHS